MTSPSILHPLVSGLGIARIPPPSCAARILESRTLGDGDALVSPSLLGAQPITAGSNDRGLCVKAGACAAQRMRAIHSYLIEAGRKAFQFRRQRSRGHADVNIYIACARKFISVLSKSGDNG